MFAIDSFSAIPRERLPFGQRGSYMAEFITLSCPSCGGRLEITKDIERFACAHCGNEHVVRRAGGIVSLAPVVAGLKQVQAGVDKTASELAIKRLRGEIGELRDELWQLLTRVYVAGESQFNGYPGGNALYNAVSQARKPKRWPGRFASGRDLAEAFRDVRVEDIRSAIPLIKAPLWGDGLQRAQELARRIIDLKTRINQKQTEQQKHEAIVQG
jgi:predicted RNA-binding Zn-ribbon protein involved in translation (DUF1610 family)